MFCLEGSNYFCIIEHLQIVDLYKCLCRCSPFLVSRQSYIRGAHSFYRSEIRYQFVIPGEEVLELCKSCNYFMREINAGRCIVHYHDIYLFCYVITIFMTINEILGNLVTVRK